MSAAPSLKYFCPMVVRPWHGARELIRAYTAIRLDDVLGAGSSCGWVPVYGSMDALLRFHPLANALCLEGDRRSFPNILRRWTADYYPSESVGHLACYTSVDALQKDFPSSKYIAAELFTDDFYLPYACESASDEHLVEFAVHAPQEGAVC